MLVEQIGSHLAIGERRDRLAWLCQIGISLRVEHRAIVARCSHPLRKLLGRHRIDGEAHIGEAVAAELRRQPRVCSRMIGLQLKARHHSRHRVDLAAELRHEEAVHDPRGGQLEADRRADRHGQLIDARDALLGVDEQPFPIERDDLNRDGLDRRGDRFARIEVMRADPGDAANQQHGHRGDRPNQHLEPAGIVEIRQVAGARVGRAKPEGDAEGGEDRRDDDRQHDAERVEQNLPFGSGDRPFRIEHAFGAAAECRGADQDNGVIQRTAY